jgi:Domain of unknown function (DUF4304)
MYDSKKYFNQARKEFIEVPMKTSGFKKYKSSFIARMTADGIFQFINFQKSGFGGDSFTVNIAIRPMHSACNNYVILMPGNRLSLIASNGKQDIWHSVIVFYKYSLPRFRYTGNYYFMKFFKVFLFSILLCFGACNFIQKDTASDKASKSRQVKNSKVLISQCASDVFTAYLYESELIKSDTSTLKIVFKNGTTKTTMLNTRLSLTEIRSCTNEYVIVSFTCGGPCYSSIFVFCDDNKKNQQFDYHQKIINNEQIIACIEDEKFENLIFRNLRNDKRLNLDISDLYLLNYGQVDSVVFTNDQLHCYYTNIKRKHVEKIVNCTGFLE